MLFTRSSGIKLIEETDLIGFVDQIAVLRETHAYLVSAGSQIHIQPELEDQEIIRDLARLDSTMFLTTSRGRVFEYNTEGELIDT